jgi:hypothetical protein
MAVAHSFLRGAAVAFLLFGLSQVHYLSARLSRRYWLHLLGDFTNWTTQGMVGRRGRNDAGRA